MYNDEKFGDQLRTAADNLFGKNRKPEERLGGNGIPVLNLDPTKVVKCKPNAYDEWLSTEDVVATTEAK